MQTDTNVFSDLVVEILGNYKMQNMQYFAIVASALKIQPTTSTPTAGIFLYENNPNVYLLFNPEYIVQLNTKQKRFLFFHLLFHLILKTKQRASVNFHDSKISNLVHDMIINKIILQEYDEYIEPPTPNVALPPKEYTGDLTYESLYDFIEDAVERGNDFMKYLEDNNIDISDTDLAADGQTLDTHLDDSINEINMPDSLRDLSKTVERGIESSNLTELVRNIMITGKINVVNYIDKFTRSMRGDVRKRTWNRRNRKYPGLLKGHRDRIVYFNLILDTSGSMADIELTNLLGAIMRNGIAFNLIQIDTEIKKMQTIKTPAELTRINDFVGRGGTVLQPAIDYCKENNLQEPVVLLSDGYTSALSFHNRTLIVYTDQPCPIAKGNSLVTQIKLSK